LEDDGLIREIVGGSGEGVKGRDMRAAFLGEKQGGNGEIFVMLGRQFQASAVRIG